MGTKIMCLSMLALQLSVMALMDGLRFHWSLKALSAGDRVKASKHLEQVLLYRAKEEAFRRTHGLDLKQPDPSPRPLGLR